MHQAQIEQLEHDAAILVAEIQRNLKIVENEK